MSDTVEDVQEAAEDTGIGEQNGNGGLAKKLLIPAAAGVGTLAATMAARKAPELIKERVMPKLEDRGGKEVAKIGQNAARELQGQGGVMGAVAGKAREKLGGAGGKEKTRRLPIQRWTDIAVPVEEVYEKWTDFEEFPKFMHRVVSVEKKDTNTIAWQEKIWFSTRQWEGEITDRRKNDRIAWKTNQGTSHSGVVSFHKLDANLTRVLVTMDFRPSGMIEKMGSGLRFVKRAVQADLARFKAYCEFDNVKGLEYEQPAKDQKDQDENADEDKDSEREQSGSDGKAEAQASRNDTDSKEREQSRQERAERREERRT
jgi:uncharacterized membrane protein